MLWTPCSFQFNHQATPPWHHCDKCYSWTGLWWCVAAGLRADGRGFRVINGKARDASVCQHVSFRDFVFEFKIQKTLLMPEGSYLDMYQQLLLWGFCYAWTQRCLWHSWKLKYLLHNVIVRQAAAAWRRETAVTWTQSDHYKAEYILWLESLLTE